MPSCERCWKWSGGNVDLYHELLAKNNCTPEDQAGDDAIECPACHRKTIHQIAHVCVNPECPDMTEGGKT